MIEAMFSGAPVFAFERGSVSEILGLDGHNNMFIKGKTCSELIQQISQYDFKNVYPRAIREYATRHFSGRKMMEGYLNVYEKLIAGNTI